MRLDNGAVQHQLERTEAARGRLTKQAEPPRVKSDAPSSALASDGMQKLAKTLAVPLFDTERVATIKKAIEKGNYPLVPAKIADAMIAARYLMRKPE